MAKQYKSVADLAEHCHIATSSARFLLEKHGIKPEVFIGDIAGYGTSALMALRKALRESEARAARQELWRKERARQEFLAAESTTDSHRAVLLEIPDTVHVLMKADWGNNYARFAEGKTYPLFKPLADEVVSQGVAVLAE